MPPWAAAPFREYVDYLRSAGEMLDLITRSINMVTSLPDVLEALTDDYDGAKKQSPEYDLDHARRAADLAKREVELGFPFLYEQNLISLWGSLEALIKDVVANWLMNKPEYFGAPEIERLKVQLGAYMILSPLEQAEYVVRLLDLQEGGGLRRGVTRFECLLSPVGLSGPIEPQVGKAIFELEQIRHVLVHRRGRADRKLIEACPWLNLGIGDRVTVNEETSTRLLLKVHEYVMGIAHRARAQFGTAQTHSE